MQCILISKALRSKTEKVQPADLDQLCEQFKVSEGLASRVLRFREFILENASGGMPLFTMPLPQIMPAYRREKVKKSYQHVYQGIVTLEISDVNSEKMASKLKDEACSLPSTLLAITGCSGMSLKILVAFTLTDGSLPTNPADVEQFHAVAAERASRLYSAVLSKPLSNVKAKPRDVFSWTYDPDLRYMPDAIPLKVNIRELRSVPAGEDLASAVKAGVVLPTDNNRRLYSRKFTAAVKNVRQSKGRLNDADDLQLVAVECMKLGIPQEQAVKEAMAEWRWESLDKDTTRALVEAVYAEHNVPKRPRKGLMQDTTIRLQEFMNARYDLRFNELTNGVEYRPNNANTFAYKLVDSRVENTMIQEANEAGLEILDRDMHRFLGSTRIRTYNAVIAYLDEHLNDWDGKTDHIGALARRVPTNNPNWEQWFHTWFLAMVAQWMNWDRYHGNAVVPLLIGPQGCGKSTFGQLLLPRELRSEGYREMVNFSNKEEVQRTLTSALLINLDEFNQISERTQQGFLKNLVQKASFKGRRPYSSVQVELPPRASFIATSNFSDVLNDPSGSRRFLVASIEGTDTIDTSTPIPYGALYSQAQQEIYNSNRAYYFTPEEQAQIEAYNSSQTEATPEVTSFLEVFSPVTIDDESTQRMSVGQLVTEITARTGFRFDNRSKRILGRYLAQEARRLHIRKNISAGYPLYHVTRHG